MGDTHTEGQMSPAVDANLLRRWSEKLCILPSGEPATIAYALGLAGSLSAQGDDAYVDPPPPGARELRIHLRANGINYVEVQLPGNEVTREQLAAHFGEERLLPRMGPFSDYVLSYWVDVPEAPFTCAVFASFKGEPTSGSAAHRIMLRRDRAAG